MFKLMGMEINAILGAQTILIWTYDMVVNDWGWNETIDNNGTPLINGFVEQLFSLSVRT